MKKLSIALLLVLSAWPLQRATACSWAIGFFHQVTNLRGRVIGADWHSTGPLQPLGYVRFLRQFKRANAKLTLYEYRWPITSYSELVQVARRVADKQGYFDFGNLKQGHYILVIDGGQGLRQEFDVEITSKVPATKNITIDVSPVFPDCKGGHEFIVETQS
jgi:hypothetical protein